MATRIWVSAFILSLAVSTAHAQDAEIKCGQDNLCPESKPCCSQYGKCGVGAYCLGGCDPVSSFKLDACAPMPVCEAYSQDSFANLNDFVKQEDYLGDPSDAPWVYSGQPVTNNGELWLTMAEGTSGTLIKSTSFMWYGQLKASIRVSPGTGVVTAFIALGDTKDEIDYEWVGSQSSATQTNFYSQGVTNYNNGKNQTNQPDVTADFHDYEIDWTPDTITWTIDGKQVRTLDREDTWNATANRYSYPQTPCQVQLSLWPAGLSTNGQGTIEWAGGLVNWNSPDMVNGYYHADFKNLETKCYDPPAGANTSGKKSYVITDKAMTNQSIEITDQDTVLGSFQATGLNMDLGKNDANKKNTTGSIPGQSGGGPSTANHGDGNDSGTSTDNGDSGSGTQPSGSSSTGFVQGNGGMNNGAAATGAPEKVMQGSLFAALVAIVGLCVL